MIYLAYDGSLNGDWVFRYALSFARRSPERSLTLVHIREGRVSDDLFEEKIEKIGRECRSHDTELILSIHPKRKDVFGSLVAAIPKDPGTILVCGTRVRSRGMAYLSGTVAEKLLRCGLFPVLAVRVVQPGLLGHPHDFLVPLGGHPRGFRWAWPFFRLFLPDMKAVYLMRGMTVSSLRHPHLSHEAIRLSRDEGGTYLSSLQEEIVGGIDRSDFHFESRVVVCDDWAGEILVHASKLKVQMILLGASQRALAHRAFHGNPLERVLREAPCDVGIYRGL